MSAIVADPQATAQVRSSGVRVEEASRIFRSDPQPSAAWDGDYRRTLSKHRPGPKKEESERDEASSNPPPALGTTASANGRQWEKLEAPGSAPARQRRSAQQYLALARPVIVKRLLAQLDGIAKYAQTPSAGVYALQIEQLAKGALERLFDDGFLDLVLAVRNALIINDAWMRYTAVEIETIQKVIRKYATVSPHHGRTFRKGALELNRLGIDTTPFELPVELLVDEEE